MSLVETCVFDKEIASIYVKPLLEEGILTVSKDTIQVLDMVIERDRIVLFYIALAQIRSNPDYWPIKQSKRGFTVEKVSVARGNDIYNGYKITSNAEDGGTILLTKSLAWELWEVIGAFVR